MIEVRAVVVNERGLHARPAALTAKTANAYKSDIVVRKGKKRANAKSVAALLMLCAVRDSELIITADGKDENAAAEALLKLIAAGFADNDRFAKSETPADAAEAPQTLPGIGVTAAMVVGRARIDSGDKDGVPRYRVPKQRLTAEVKRYDKALAAVRDGFNKTRAQVAALPGAAEITPFIDLYLALLDDPEFAQKPRRLIRRLRINAEAALRARVDVVNDSFRRIPDSYLRERHRDVENVMKRLLAAMAGRRRAPAPAARGENLILVAAELDPADVIRIRQQGYAGFITESGGRASHTAILARSMGMPALVGARGALAHIAHDARILLDAAAESAFINPDDDLLSQHQARRGGAKSAARRRQSAGRGVKSADGETVRLHGNMELPQDAAAAAEAGVDGIGLFRSEFLFLNRADLPGEDEQFEIYRDALARMAPLPVVIRTLDLGADKMPAAAEEDKTINPALGVRAIRYCLHAPELFLTQLRALLRAGAAAGNLRVLLPMLSHPSELRRAMTMAENAAEQLRVKRGIDRPLPPFGGMIEVPSAAFIMRALAKRLAFFSIGTNDLIQYTLAADRNEEQLAPLCDPLHPAILHLLAMIVNNAAQVKRDVILCGELAGDAAMTRLMLALGLRQLSMNAANVDDVRARVRRSDCAALRGMARQLLRAPDPDAAKSVAEKMNGLS